MYQQDITRAHTPIPFLKTDVNVRAPRDGLTLKHNIYSYFPSGSDGSRGTSMLVLKDPIERGNHHRSLGKRCNQRLPAQDICTRCRHKIHAQDADTRCGHTMQTQRTTKERKERSSNTDCGRDSNISAVKSILTLYQVSIEAPAISHSDQSFNIEIVTRTPGPMQNLVLLVSPRSYFALRPSTREVEGCDTNA